MELPSILKYDIIDEKPPQSELPEPEPEVATETGETIDAPRDKNPIVDEMLEGDLLEDALPKFVPKPKPSDDMFEEDIIKPEPKKAPAIKVVKEPEQEPVKKTRGGKVKGYNKNGTKRKPMSEEHKAKLALAREKAKAKREYLKKVRQEEKAEKDEIKELEKKVATKRKQKKVKDLKEELDTLDPPEETVETKPVPAPKVSAPRPIPQAQNQYLTRADLEQAQLSTLVAYEKMRKARKEEKKKKQQEQEYQAEVMNTIQKINGWKESAGIYGNCF